MGHNFARALSFNSRTLDYAACPNRNLILAKTEDYIIIRAPASPLCEISARARDTAIAIYGILETMREFVVQRNFSPSLSLSSCLLLSQSVWRIEYESLPVGYLLRDDPEIAAGL